jgi:hypothetical protein
VEQSAGTRVALVPGTLALLPEYAGLEDPVAELRAACLGAAGWLGSDVTVLADEQGGRVAAYLLEAAPQPARAGDAAYLVVGNGSATRTEQAPGHLDERAAAFDAALGGGLRAGHVEVDAELAGELWARLGGIEELAGLGELGPATVDYDDDPFGVQYWVMRWTCPS